MAAQVDLFFDSNANSAASGFNNLGGSMGGVISIAAKAAAAFVAVNAIIAAGIGITAKAAADYEQLEISFSVFLGSVEKANVLLGELEDFSISTPFTTEQVTGAARSLLAFGFSGENVVGTLRTLGDISAGTGKDLGELARIFGKIKGNTRLMGEELNQLIDAGFNPLEIISKQTGKSILQLRDDMSKGLVSFDQLKGAFISATSAGGLFFQLTEKQSKSAKGLFSTLLSGFDVLKRKIGEEFLEAIKDALGTSITLMGDMVMSVKNNGPLIRELFTEWAKLMIQVGRVAITVFKFIVIPLLALVTTQGNFALAIFEKIVAKILKIGSLLTTGAISKGLSLQADEELEKAGKRQAAIGKATSAAFKGVDIADDLLTKLDKTINNNATISAQNRQTSENQVKVANADRIKQ